MPSPLLGPLGNGWVGSVQLGDHLDLHLACHTSSFVASNPTTGPRYAIYDGGGTKRASGVLPRKDQSTTGWFQHPYRLTTAGWTAGVGTILLTDVVAGNTRHRLLRFRLVAGGDAGGQVIGVEEVHRPEATHLVYETEDGKILDGRNPHFVAPP